MPDTPTIAPPASASPDLDASVLKAGLQRLLRRSASYLSPRSHRLKILHIERNVHSSSFDSYITTCQFNSLPPFRVLCKEGSGAVNAPYENKGGVNYEIRVYRDLLNSRTAPHVPRFMGSWLNPLTQRSWLVLEYLDDAAKLGRHSADTTDIPAVGTWLGNFHRLAAPQTHGRRRWLMRYTHEYYRGWATRTLNFAQPLLTQMPWLPAVCHAFPDLAATHLLAPPMTLIHGEFYPGNILIQQGVIRVVDWESLAVAPGEIDLATLGERWGSTALLWEQQYAAARWPDGAPPDFPQRLRAAKIYSHLRWLGDRPQWTNGEARWRFAELFQISGAAGLIAEDRFPKPTTLNRVPRKSRKLKVLE